MKKKTVDGIPGVVKRIVEKGVHYVDEKHGYDMTEVEDEQRSADFTVSLIEDMKLAARKKQGKVAGEGQYATEESLGLWQSGEVKAPDFDRAGASEGLQHVADAIAFVQMSTGVISEERYLEAAGFDVQRSIVGELKRQLDEKGLSIPTIQLTLSRLSTRTKDNLKST